MPAVLEARLSWGLELLEAAEEAADRAREQVMQAHEIARRGVLVEHELLHRHTQHERHDEHRKGCGEAPKDWVAGAAS